MPKVILLVQLYTDLNISKSYFPTVGLSFDHSSTKVCMRSDTDVGCEHLARFSRVEIRSSHPFYKVLLYSSFMFIRMRYVTKRRQMYRLSEFS